MFRRSTRPHLVFLARISDTLSSPEDWHVDESTVRRTVERVEDALIKSDEFALPGRKALRDNHTLEVVVVDIAESPVERPKKTTGLLLG